MKFVLLYVYVHFTFVLMNLFDRIDCLIWKCRYKVILFACPKEFVCDRLSSADTLYVQEPSKRCELNEPPSRLRSPSRPLALLPAESSTIGWKWQPISVCHYSCMTPGIGLKLVEGKACKNCEPVISIKACSPQKDVSTISIIILYSGNLNNYRVYI